MKKLSGISVSEQSMFLAFFRIISIISAIVGASILLPIIVAYQFGETNALRAFVFTMALSWILALTSVIIKQRKKVLLGTRSAFFVVAISWVTVILFGTIPLYMSHAAPTFLDALFESVSGFTTTGATVISNLDNLPRSINLWRCETHWLGGMGIIALTVAILPLIGVGGFQLIKAETTGIEKGKLTPKITNTAKVLWLIYIGFTLVETIALRLTGMDWTDSLSHAFSSLGTGGFSTRDANLGAFKSQAAEWICAIFMLLAGINFSLYYHLFTKQAKLILTSSELKAYLAIIFFATLLIAISGVDENPLTNLRLSFLHVVSIITTTGFTTRDYTTWMPLAQIVLLSLYLIGGCSGSTAGGVKVIRHVALFKAFKIETLKMLHPHGIFALRIDGRVARDDLVRTVASFIFVYMLLVFVSAILGAYAGLDVWTAFTGALSMVGNVGPSFGTLGPSGNFALLPDLLKGWYCFAMLAGRLELYTVIIFFTKSFWTK